MSPLLKMKPGCRTSPRVLVWRGEATAASSAACSARARLLEHACVWACGRLLVHVCVCVVAGITAGARAPRPVDGWMRSVLFS